MDFEEYMQKYSQRISMILSLFDRKALELSYDRLEKEGQVDTELLYVREGEEEHTGIFLFGFDFFIKELEEQQFKNSISHAPLSYRLLRAYSTLKKKQKQVKVSELATALQDREKDSREMHRFISKILSNAYYLNWKLEPIKKDIEGDYYVEIPALYLQRLTTRYNFEMVAAIYENRQFFIFVNSRGKLNVVFKQKNLVSRRDVETHLLPKLKDIFRIQEIHVQDN